MTENKQNISPDILMLGEIPENSESDPDDLLLQTFLDIGEEMVVAGAEIWRVTDSITRMCEAYHFTRINVFIIVSNLQATVQTPEGRILTHIRCIARDDVNFDRLDYLNDLSRYICANRPDVPEMKRRLVNVMARRPQSRMVSVLGDVCASAGFTVFFGGSPLDGAASAVMGVVLWLFLRFIQTREHNTIVRNFEASFIGGVLALLLVHIGIGQDPGVIMMGGIMLLIPGIAMTNAIRDMLFGDTASGLLRLFNALIVAAAIASGFALAIILLRGVL